MTGKTEAGRTLFVRNLPYSTTDDQLLSVFGKYGAVKSCFTVKDKGVIDRCKGFGYVIFEKPEDAKKARGGVRKVKGRVVQIVFADKRPLRGKHKPEVEGEREGEDESEDDSGSDYETLTEGENATIATIKHNKPKSERREARYDVGRVVMVTGIPEDTRKSMLRKKCAKYGPLEGFEYPVATMEQETKDEEVNGKIAHVIYKNYADARKAVTGLNGLKLESTVNPLSAMLMSKEGKVVSKVTLAKSRLIVRNLSFSVKLKDLLKLFSPYGNVREVHIPRKPNGYMRGYAFVQFTAYFDAAKAIEGVNGMEIKGRQVAVDWVVPKATYESSLHISEDMEGEKCEEDGPGSDIERGREGGREDSEFSEDDTSSESVSEEDDEEEKKPFKADVHEGKTVFVRNLPLESSEEELMELFSQFGRVRYARIVLDKETGLSRGTAFVQFTHPSSLQRCLETSTTDNEGETLWYNGRQLDVSLALSPRELRTMQERGADKTDKRNLYLAKEGAVLPGTEAAEGLSKIELAKRLKAQAEKKSKLANPNFYVSKTRLSVRNLPTQTTEKRLKEIFMSVIDTGKITQLKILRSKDRVDSQGIGRSKGFAFVEFSTHEAALTALRATNNNPHIFDNRKRLIVEFAVEDVRILRAREVKKKHTKAKMRSGELQDSREIEEEREGKESPGMRRRERDEGETIQRNKRVEWQVKCKEKRLRKRERESDKKDSDLGKSSTAGSLKEDSVFVMKRNSVTERQPQKRQIEKEKSLGKEDGVPAAKRSRKGRKGGAEQREEKAFEELVDTYRKKLLSLRK